MLPGITRLSGSGFTGRGRQRWHRDWDASRADPPIDYVEAIVVEVFEEPDGVESDVGAHIPDRSSWVRQARRIGLRVRVPSSG